MSWTKEGTIASYDRTYARGWIDFEGDQAGGVGFVGTCFYGARGTSPSKGRRVTVVFTADSMVLAVINRDKCTAEDPCFEDDCPFCKGGPGCT